MKENEQKQKLAGPYGEVVKELLLTKLPKGTSYQKAKNYLNSTLGTDYSGGAFRYFCDRTPELALHLKKREVTGVAKVLQERKKSNTSKQHSNQKPKDVSVILSGASEHLSQVGLAQDMLEDLKDNVCELHEKFDKLKIFIEEIRPYLRKNLDEGDAAKLAKAIMLEFNKD